MHFQRTRTLFLAAFLTLASASLAHAQENLAPDNAPKPAVEAADKSDVLKSDAFDASLSLAANGSAAKRIDERAFWSGAAPRTTREILYGGEGDDKDADLEGQNGKTAAQPYTPLTSDQKMKRAFKRAFLSPVGYATTAFSAAMTEYGEEDLPHKTTEDRFADGLTRFAIKSATRATRTMLGSGVYPVLFKQDPRYDRARSKNPGRRILHAVSRVFVARADDGGLAPNYSRWAGNLSASALSNIWERSTVKHDRRGVDATFRRFGNSFVGDAVRLVVVSEFLPDLVKIFRRK
jgi:hypothetical protein